MSEPSAEPQGVRELLGQIRRRPEMYLGGKSLTALGHVMFGYAWACYSQRLPEADLLETYGLEKRFVRWLEDHKGIGYGSCGPLGHLKEICGNDSAALDRFFELLDEFETTRDITQ